MDFLPKDILLCLYKLWGFFVCLLCFILCVNTLLSLLKHLDSRAVLIFSYFLVT